MDDYKYYLQNRSSIKEIKVNKLRFDDKLDLEDFTNIFDIYDSTRGPIIKALFVISVVTILLIFSVLLMSKVNIEIIFMIIICISVVIIATTGLLTITWALDKVKAKKQIGVFIEKRDNKALIYCKGQGITKANFYIDYWHSSRINKGDLVFIYKIRNKYYAIKGYSDEINKSDQNDI